MAYMFSVDTCAKFRSHNPAAALLVFVSTLNWHLQEGLSARTHSDLRSIRAFRGDFCAHISRDRCARRWPLDVRHLEERISHAVVAFTCASREHSLSILTVRNKMSENWLLKYSYWTLDYQWIPTRGSFKLPIGVGGCERFICCSLNEYCLPFPSNRSQNELHKNWQKFMHIMLCNPYDFKRSLWYIDLRVYRYRKESC